MFAASSRLQEAEVCIWHRIWLHLVMLFKHRLIMSARLRASTCAVAGTTLDADVSIMHDAEHVL